MPVIAADTRRPIFMGGRACRCLRPALGALRAVGDDSTSYACGNPPNRADYSFPDDAELYRMDLADYKACVGQPQDIYSSTPVDSPAPPPPPQVDPNSDDAIASSALSWTSTIGMDPSLYDSWKAQIMAALSAGILDPGGEYASSTGHCAGASAPPGPGDLQLAAMATGIATTGATAGAMIATATSVIPTATSVIPIIGIVGSVTALFLSLVGKLFGPPVSELEHKTLCPAVSAANAVLTQITEELQAGYIDESRAVSAINDLQNGFQSHVASIQYIQTPNDTQFMISALGALVTKNTNVVYPALGQQAAAALAAAQAAQKASIDAEATAAAQAAVAAAMASQATPVSTVPPAPVATAPVTAPVQPAAAPPTQTTGPAPTVSVPSASSSWTDWFTKNTPMFGWQVPNWALVLGGAILLLGD